MLRSRQLLHWNTRDTHVVFRFCIPDLTADIRYAIFGGPNNFCPALSLPAPALTVHHLYDECLNIPT